MFLRPTPEQACQVDRRWRDEDVLLNSIFSINVGLTRNELEMPFPTAGAMDGCIEKGGRDP